MYLGDPKAALLAGAAKAEDPNAPPLPDPNAVEPNPLEAPPELFPPPNGLGAA